MYDYTQALERSRISRAARSEPTEINVLDREWLLLPDVFSPAGTNSSLTHLRLLEFPVGGSFLEIGCGAGIIAVSAALAGCRSVLATDVNPAAVGNTAANATRFGVESTVTCVHSDMFDSVPDGADFDVVYWHSNNVWTPASLAIGNVHELAYVDPGYRAHQRFFHGARSRLAPGGRILLALSSRAGRGALDDLAAAAGQRLRSVRAATVPEPEGPVVYELLEVVPR